MDHRSYNPLTLPKLKIQIRTHLMPTLSIVIPTFNEQDNVRQVYQAVAAALIDRDWEIIFVDDASQDATTREVMALNREDLRVRLIRRIGRRGLSSACIEGMLASTSAFVAVMDADLQHDETLLPLMLARLEQNSALDLVVGSRYCQSASMGTLANHRVRISQWATRFSQFFAQTTVTDPMSGFFMLRFSKLEEIAPRLSGIGFKVLLDILMSSRDKWVTEELPYEMRSRHQGESKLDAKVAYDYFLMIADKTIGVYFPIRLLMFLMVGATGVLVQLFFVWLFHLGMNIEFVTATIAATAVAMSSNFILNNWFTHYDRRLTGVLMIKGYLSFVLACSIGATMNVFVADISFENLGVWWLASLLGAVFGSIWNYTMSNILTWRTRQA
jgi:dolichol-phosphate mannosyltransferase